MRKFQKTKIFHVLVLAAFFINTVLPLDVRADNEPWNAGGQSLSGETMTAASPTNTQATQEPANNPICTTKPVYLHSGEEVYECTDLEIPGRGLNVAIKHRYRSGKNFNGPFGFGWTINYYMRLRPLNNGNVVIHKGDGRTDEYQFQAGQYIPPAGFYQTLVQETNGTWTLTEKNGEQKIFDVNGNLSAIRDRNANQITFTYDAQGLLPIIGTSRFAQNSNRGVLAFDYRLTTITDTVGRTVSFFYNPDGRLQRITDYSGRNVTFTYDPNTDDLLTITRPTTPQYLQGLTKTFTYDPEHNLRTITDPKNQTFVTNHYNAAGKVERQDLGSGTFLFDYSVANRTTVTDRNGNVVRYDFNANGNMTRKEEFTRGIRVGDPASFITAYAYNTNMEMTSITYPRGNGVKFVYDDTNPSHRARGNLIQIRRKRVMSASDNNTNDIVTTLTYETRFNQIKTITDPRGQVTTLIYDYELPTTNWRYSTRGNVVEIRQPTVNGQIPVTGIAYNAQGQPFIVQDPNGIFTVYNYYPATGYLQNIIKDPTGINAVTAFTYDQWGNLDTITDAENHVTDVDFNAVGWLTQERNPLGFLTKYSYDKNGNVERVERQANAAATVWQTTNFTYTVLNKLATVTDSLNRVTTLGYDNNENMTSVLDAETHTTLNEFDERNLLFKTRDANTPQGVTKYDYDTNGILSRITDANGNVTNYTNDLFNRQERVTYADTRFSQFTYDKNSNLINHQTPSLQNIAYVYDELNRLTNKNFPQNTTLDIAYGYDLGSRLTLARHTTTTNPLSIINFTYDNLNRVQTTTQILNSLNPLTLTYQYDKMGNRTKVTYPSGKVVDYTYDANDRMDLVKVNNTTIADYDWDLLDRRQRLDHLTSTVSRTSYQFDMANQLSSLENVHLPSTLISRFDYTLYDNVGNRRTMDVRRGTASPVTTSYGYNNIYELTSVTGGQTHNFQYDNVANRTNVDNVVYQPNNVNQYALVGTQQYSYDNNGNLTSDGANTYTYDAENRLSSMVNGLWSASYSYDGFNRRVSKTVNGVRTYFFNDGDREIEERDSTGALLADYVYGDSIDEVLTMTRGGSTYYYHYDGLGSVTDLTNAAGAIIESYTYDVYGQPSQTSTVGNPYLFTGRRLDPESGLYYYRSRMYSPTIGRFLQRDPIGYYDSMNLMQYVGNNPVNWIDPYGLFDLNDAIRGAITGGIGGAVTGGLIGAFGGPTVPFTAMGGILIGGGLGAIGGFIRGGYSSDHPIIGGALGGATAGAVCGLQGALAGSIAGGISGALGRDRVESRAQTTVNAMSQGGITGAIGGGLAGGIGGAITGAGGGIIKGGINSQEDLLKWK